MSQHIPLEEYVSDRHLVGIGLIVAEWAQVEQLLKVALCNLIANDQAGYTQTPVLYVVTGMEARTTIGLLRTLARIRIPSKEQQTRLDKILDGIERLKQWRDTVAHATWLEGETPKTIKPYGIKTVGRVKRLGGQITAQNLRAIAISPIGMVLTLLASFKTMGS